VNGHHQRDRSGPKGACQQRNWPTRNRSACVAVAMATYSLLNHRIDRSQLGLQCWRVHFCHGNERRRAFRNHTRATNSFRTILVVIGSSVLSSVISFRDVWAYAQAQGSDDVDHERDITLAIHAAIPDLITDPIRSNPHFHAVGTAVHQGRSPIASQCWFHEFRFTSYRLAAAASRP
jgi:hypothetical protein